MAKVVDINKKKKPNPLEKMSMEALADYLGELQAKSTSAQKEYDRARIVGEQRMKNEVGISIPITGEMYSIVLSRDLKRVIDPVAFIDKVTDKKALRVSLKVVLKHATRTVPKDTLRGLIKLVKSKVPMLHVQSLTREVHAGKREEK